MGLLARWPRQEPISVVTEQSDQLTCYLKCLLQKHPSLPPCVESLFSECISIQVSLGDFVKIIKCYGMASFLELSLLLLLDLALVVVPH